MENLTKENFFDELNAKYPEGMKVFCAWIDDYKDKNDWNRLFNSDSDWQDMHGKNAPARKYHDLPGAMQAGIYLQFAQERGGCEYIIDVYEFDLKEDFTGMIIMLQNESGL